MPPPLSVAMAVHNGMPYVEASVRSILAQSFSDFEFVIGDDGSDDGTSDVLKALASEDSRIRLLRREKRSGLAESGNWVVGETRAAIVAIQHADDVAHPERLSSQFPLFLSEPDVALVATLCDGIDEEGHKVRPADWWRLIRGAPFAPFAHSSIIFRRASFDRAGQYRAEAEYWEDLDLYLRLGEIGRLLVVPKVLVSVRHARISHRLRDRQEQVENAVDLMFRSTAAYQLGEDWNRILRERCAPRRVHPRTFVARGSTWLWLGRAPGQLRRMLLRARYRADLATVRSVAWVLWSSISPTSLRLAVRAMMNARNGIARPIVAQRPFIDWHPRGTVPKSAVAQPGHGTAPGLAPAELASEGGR